MSKLFFTNESLETFVNEIETHVSNAVSTKANNEHIHNIADISNLQTSLDELAATVSTKANASHSHDDRYYTETEIDTKLSTKADSTHNHAGLYDVNGAAAEALDTANAYTDSKIDALVGEGASATLDTIGEISSAIEDNQDAIDLLNSAIANKANSADLTSHINNSVNHITNAERNEWVAAKAHADTAHAPSNAEANQNAFSNIVVGNSTIAADSKTDTLTLVAGSNVTLTPNVDGDSITIASTNTVYTHPTSAGNKHIPAGGASGQILRWSADGTAAWGADNNTTYSNATQSASGLMSSSDKAKLDGIAEGANAYTLPSAGSSLGGVKSGGSVSISSGVITVNDDSHNHVIANVDGLQSALDGKAASSHNHDGSYYTEVEIDTLLSGKANSSHTHSIANITNLQTTLDGKAATSHGTHVSYSTTAPVMDGTASVGTASTVARSDHKHPTDTSRAAQTSLDSHTSNKSNPHGVSLSQLGLTATAAELNIMDGITATTAELNYVDGVTSNIQTQLNGKAASSHSHDIHSQKSMSNTDLNTIKTAGWYYGYTGMTNAPQQTIAVMEVLVYSPDWIVQRFIIVNGAEYIRYWHSATTWTEWKTMIRSDNISSQSVNYATSAGTATTSNAVAWSGVTSKPSYYDAKAIKSITRSGTTFTYTCMDGTTGTFTQQDNNTTYSAVTTSANGLMVASDKSKLDGMVLATVSEVETYLGI